MPRIQYAIPDPVILSAYPVGAARKALTPLRRTAEGALAPDACAALHALHFAVLAAGGDFRVTSATRSLNTQRAARAKYDRWVAAGKPAPGSAGFDASTMKAAYVAEPGYSFHNAGRAIDVDLASLQFPGVPADRQLDRLWELAKPLGWSPVIRSADEGAKEAWHFDFYGPWAKTLARRGYAETAMAACLDIGGTGYGRDAEREVQAQLHRAGFDPGAIDGALGAKTRAALVAVGVSPNLPLADILAAVRALADG